MLMKKVILFMLSMMLMLSLPIVASDVDIGNRVSLDDVNIEYVTQDVTSDVITVVQTLALFNTQVHQMNNLTVAYIKYGRMIHMLPMANLNYSLGITYIAKIGGEASQAVCNKRESDTYINKAENRQLDDTGIGLIKPDNHTANLTAEDISYLWNKSYQRQ